MRRRPFVFSCAALAVCSCARAPAAPVVAPPASAPVAIAPMPTTTPEAKPVEETIEPLRNAACVLRGDPGKLLQYVFARYHGRPFASVNDPVTNIEVRLPAGRENGTFTLATEDLELRGEIDFDSLVIRPRDPAPIEGWLVVERMKPLLVSTDGKLQGTPDSPLKIGRACSELTLTAASGPPAGEEDFLKVNARDVLRIQPGGAVVGQVEGPSPPGYSASDYSPRKVFVLERRGKDVRISVPTATGSVYGWTSASVLVGPRKIPAPPSPDPSTSTAATAPPAIRCTADVPIYVRDRGGPVRVGTLKAGRPLEAIGLELPSDSTDPKAELPIRLGVQRHNPRPPNELVPFVLGASLASCASH